MYLTRKEKIDILLSIGLQTTTNYMIKATELEKGVNHYRATKPLIDASKTAKLQQSKDDPCL